MKVKEIRELTSDKILDKITEEGNLLFRLKMKHAVSPLDNPLKIKETKRSVARLKTILREREIADKS